MQIAKNIPDEYVTFPLEDKCYFGFDQTEPSVYVHSSFESWEFYENLEEATDEDILHFVERSGALDFLNDPEEDTYSLNDGEEI